MATDKQMLTAKQKTTICNLTEMGKMAILRALTSNDISKRQRYRLEAEGYADLIAIFAQPFKLDW